MKAIHHIILPVLLLIAFNTVEAQPDKPASGKIYYSRDKGETWERADNGFPPNVVVNDLAMANGLIVAGTEAHGIFLTRDHLKSWEASNAGLPENIKVDAVTTFDDLIILGSNQHGIFISADKGKSWHAANKGLNNHTIRCLYVFEQMILAGSNDGIYVSVDKGASWRQSFPKEQVNGITVVKGKIYAGTAKGIILSADNGHHWKTIFNRSALHNVSSNGEYLFAMCYTPAVLKTKDDGLHWIRSDLGLPARYTFQVKSTAQRLIACQWDGIYRSDDNGNNWIKTSKGLPPGKAFKELLITGSAIVIAGP